MFAAAHQNATAGEIVFDLNSSLKVDFKLSKNNGCQLYCFWRCISFTCVNQPACHNNFPPSAFPSASFSPKKRTESGRNSPLGVTLTVWILLLSRLHHAVMVVVCMDWLRLDCREYRNDTSTQTLTIMDLNMNVNMNMKNLTLNIKNVIYSELPLFLPLVLSLWLVVCVYVCETLDIDKSTSWVWPWPQTACRSIRSRRPS